MINKKLLPLTMMMLIICFSTRAWGQKDKQYLITEYGVKVDGRTMNTTAIQSAIDKVSKKGGGKIVFPKGKYLTGSIALKSNVELHLEEDAIILGSTNPRDYYDMQVDGRPDSPKKDDNSQMALIVAYKADNIAISGKGTIDGQGLALALAVDSLHHEGIVVDPDYNKRRHRPNEKMRPKMTRISSCNNVKFSGVTFKNASCWGLSIELCTNLVLNGLNIQNMAYWNNDGMDITDCRNVQVINCNVNSADDGICLKSYYPGHTNDSIYIANCKVRSSASAIKFGTASYGGFRNVKIENIEVYDTYRSAIAIESVDGGLIENIDVSNITAKNTGNAIFIRLGHRGGEKPGIIRNVNISNIKVEIPFTRPDALYDLRASQPGFHHNPFPSSITGIPGHYVEDVTIEDIEIIYPGGSSKGQAYVPLSRLEQVPEQIKNYPEFHMFGELPAYGFYVRHARGITMKNIKLKLVNDDFRPAYVFDDVKDIKLDDIQLPEEKNKNQYVLKDVEGFKLLPEDENQVIRMH